MFGDGRSTTPTLTLSSAEGSETQRERWRLLIPLFDRFCVNNWLLSLAHHTGNNETALVCRSCQPDEVASQVVVETGSKGNGSSGAAISPQQLYKWRLVTWE
jgi:hypothetical protein